jgi:hypothetical protein
MAGMSVQRMADGLWRWTARHPQWNRATDWHEIVCSVYCETAAAIVVIDPLVPTEGDDADRFWGAFDRDVARLGLPVVVLLTCRWHLRSADAFRSRHGARIMAPTTAGLAIADGVVELVADEDEVLPGVVALVTGSPAPNEECVYILTEYRTAVVGDILIGDADGSLRLADPGWYANSDAERAWYHTALTPSLGRVLHYDIEHLLLGHGEPVRPDPATTLRAVLARHGGEMALPPIGGT